jgi:elongation factor Ts
MSAKDVQKLRAMTGAGIMECKKCLEETGGNFEKAAKLISERGLAKADKRADRETGAGLVQSYVHNDRVGALVELRSETDFVARSEPFKELAKNLAMQVAAMDPESTEALLAQPFIKDASKSVKELVSDVITKVGENVRIGKFYRLEL